MPLVSKTFDQLLDFTRTSAATFVGSNGLIQNTAASRNLLLQTQQFDNAAWPKTALTATANTVTAPDGTSTADTLTDTVATSNHYAAQTITTTAATTYTMSAYVKNNGRGFVILNLANLSGATNYAAVSFNLSTGAVVNTLANGTGYSVSSSSITSVGDGWYRCTMTAVVGSTTATTASVALSSAGTIGAYGLDSYLGNGSGIYIWGAQLEVVPAANLVLGSELVTNGTFAGASTTGWTAAGSATISGTGDVLTVTNGATAFGYAVTSITTIVGRTYYVTYQVTGGTSTGNLYIGTASGGFDNYAGPNQSAGSYTVAFVATATTTYLRLGNSVNTSGATFIVDNISTKEITAITGMPTTYTRNNGGVFPPRFDYDPVTLAPKGLLIEEQRTNLALQSDLLTTPTWTGVRIDRTTNGNYARLTATENNVNGGFFTYTPAPLAASTYTTSVNVSKTSANKFILRPTNPLNSASVASVGVDPATGVATTPSASVDFSNPSVKVEDRGSDWRVSLTFTTLSTIQVQMRLFVVDATSGLPVTLGANIDVRYAQFEVGSFATSYIPTVASQVTRTADLCSIVAPNFAPWYNQAEGTLLCEFDTTTLNTSVPTTYTAASVSDGTTNNYNILYTYSNFAGGQVRTGNVQQADLNAGGSPANNTTIKAVIAYATNDIAVTANGTVVKTDTSAAINTTMSQLGIGSRASSSFLNGHIRSIRYYPTRLTNAQLQALTA